MNLEQFRAILWLRWRLSRNQFIRGGSLNAAIAVVVGIFLALGACGTAVGGFAGGWAAGGKASPEVDLLILDGVVFLFLIVFGAGLMVEIQRSESIDLPRLLHLPTSLKQVFVLNYAISHLSPGMVFFLPGLFGLCAGFVLGGGMMMVLLAPALFGLVFAITAWGYCLRGWLAALMSNQRRRRSVVVWITLAFVILGQLPNLVIQTSISRVAKPSTPGSNKARATPASMLTPALRAGHWLVPLGWPGYAALTLKEGEALPALAVAAGGWLLAGLGLLRSYRMTLRFYQGDDKSRVQPVTPVPAAGPPPITGRPPLIERRVPWVPEEAGALAVATLRSLLRAPELRMAFIMPVVILVVFGSSWGRFHSIPARHAGPDGKPAAATPALSVLSANKGGWGVLFATGAAGLAVLSFGQTMGNAFGLDRNGFRALVLLPTRRDYVLLAKNLAIFPFAATVCLALLLLLLCFGVISVSGFVLGLLQAPTLYLAACLAANYSSILAPYRMAPGSLQAKKPKPIIILAVFANLLLMPLLSPLVLIPPALHIWFNWAGWLPWFPVAPVAAAVILALTVLLYRAVLPSQGRLLQRREQMILLAVTEEVD